MFGKFITIEGTEGAGKTTAIQAILEVLQTLGVSETIVTREPGGTDISEKIRNILLDSSLTNMHEDTELLLMFAARAQHWNQKILPFLQKGSWVVADRFVDSSFAYQGGGRNIDFTKISTLENMILQGSKPDLTLLLDIDPEIGMVRAKQRNSLDRFEQEKMDFFARVREVFLLRASQDPDRFVIIDASLSADEVSLKVKNVVEEFYVSLAN